MASFGTVQGKKKLPSMAATKGGPGGGKPIAPTGPRLPANAANPGWATDASMPPGGWAMAQPGDHVPQVGRGHMKAAKGGPTRVLTDAQRRRRTIRQALGIADVRKATTSQLDTARVNHGFLTRGQVKKKRARVRPTTVTSPGTPFGAAPRMKKR